MKKPKAHKLPDSTQLKIAQHRERHGTTYDKLAEMFNCTKNQVRGALAAYAEGKLTGRRGKRSAAPSAPKAGATFEAQYDLAMQELASASLDPIERIQMLEKLANTRKTMQQIELQGHLKRTDADLFARTVRYFRPDATDEDVIKIYHEVVALCKASL